MYIELLQPVVGMGDFVEGSRHQFNLSVGMRVHVEDTHAAKWCASGVAKQIHAAPERETAALCTPENAALSSPRKKAKRRE